MKNGGVPGGSRMGRYNATEERRRNTVGSRIAEARKRRGWSLAVFSEVLSDYGVKITTGGAGKWETGDTVPNAYQLLAICSALGIEEQLPDFLERRSPLLDERGLRKVEEYREDLIASGRYRPASAEIRYVELPVSRLAVSAGTGAFLDEGSFETVRVPESTVPAGAEFGIRVSGDSMEPVYHDGQIVWVQRCDRLRPGEAGVFVYDGEGYLKVYGEREPEEDQAAEFTDSQGVVRPQPVLISWNPAYAPRPVAPGAPFQVVGRAL